jgi:hypothetical protein
MGPSLSSPALLALVGPVERSVGEYIVSEGLVIDGLGRVGRGGMLDVDEAAVALRYGELALLLRTVSGSSRRGLRSAWASTALTLTKILYFRSSGLGNVVVFSESGWSNSLSPKTSVIVCIIFLCCSGLQCTSSEMIRGYGVASNAQRLMALMQSAKGTDVVPV